MVITVAQDRSKKGKVGMFREEGLYHIHHIYGIISGKYH